MPLVYEEACKALANVSTVLDAKYFADKADALAAWAKIYRSDEADLQSRRLKLHAFRKMGEIAEQIRPTSNTAKGGHRAKGALSLLKENGLSHQKAANALSISRVDAKQFDKMIDSKRPPGIISAMRYGLGRGIPARTVSSREYDILFGAGYTTTGFSHFVRKHNNIDVSRFSELETDKSLSLVRVCADWLDELERRLQHRKSQFSKKSK